MGEIVNLRLARKAKARRDKEASAVANRALHGRTKGQSAQEAADRARSEERLDGARRDD